MIIDHHTPFASPASESQVSSLSKPKPEEAQSLAESQITAQSLIVESTVSISQQALQRQAQESQALVELNNEKDAKLKMQYQDNLALFIANAQRYSQQDVVVPMIENRAAIAAYSLIENKVVATVASNELEE